MYQLVRGRRVGGGVAGGRAGREREVLYHIFFPLLLPETRHQPPFLCSEWLLVLLPLLWCSLCVATYLRRHGREGWRPSTCRALQKGRKDKLASILHVLTIAQEDNIESN